MSSKYLICAKAAVGSAVSPAWWGGLCRLPQAQGQGAHQPSPTLGSGSEMIYSLCLLFVVPFVLLLLHAILGQRKFLPIAFGLLTASSLYVLITAILGHSTIPYTVINLLLTCAYILALVNSFKGFTIKALTWVACCLVWLVSFVYLMDLFSAYSYYTEHNFHLYVWTDAGNALTLDLLGYWLLLFGLKKTASPKKKKNEEPLDTEEALRLLQEKLELGIIDNVEYQLQRADIIAKI